MKASLISEQTPFQRIHDLEVLLDLALIKHPLWESMRSGTQLLTQYAVQFRYPGETADKEEARDAIAAMKRCKKDIAPHCG